MKYLKNKDFIVSITFIAFITVVFAGTVLTHVKDIAWNVMRNSESYVTDNSVNSKARSYITAYESAFNDNIIVKEKCVDFFGLLQKAMGKRVIPTNGFTGTIVKGNDNKLYTANSVTVSNSKRNYSNEDIDAYANSLIELKSLLSSQNTDILYVQVPQKYHSGVKVPISLDADYSDSRIKKMKSLIGDKIDYIDFNEIIEKDDSIKRDDVFFKTDHHWTAESAFLCYQSICSYINSNFSFSINPDLFDRDNWNFNILKNSYLGSSGVRVGKYYVGKDNFALITPKFETDFVRNYVSQKTVTYSGDFRHALINGYETFMKGNYKELSWGCYCGSDTSFVSIKNNLAENEKKILVVKDSFALPICAFMSTTCKQLDICDLRYYNSSLVELAKKEGYDLVVFIYNPSAFDTAFFNFNK
ncbi:MAG: hypothetical protein IKZ59_04800 [Clostridia bacterium]|nr:hypothetical protein [Clostridia bacterium]